jgi:hypothetical protein
MKWNPNTHFPITSRALGHRKSPILGTKINTNTEWQEYEGFAGTLAHLTQSNPSENSTSIYCSISSQYIDRHQRSSNPADGPRLGRRQTPTANRKLDYKLDAAIPAKAACEQEPCFGVANTDGV